MFRTAIWFLLLLAGCRASLDYGRFCGTPDDVGYVNEPELLEKTELLCRRQMLDAPVLSRLPPDALPSSLIRREDLEFIAREPGFGRDELMDGSPGLVGALAHFSRCSASVVRRGMSWTEIAISRTEPEWDEALLRSSEVRTPSTPSRRLAAMVRWFHRHPKTRNVGRIVRFERTLGVWRAAYLLPEEERLRLRPVEVRQCPAAPEEPLYLPLEPELTPPLFLPSEKNIIVHDLESQMERIEGRFIARCRVTREGEARDCCVRQSLRRLDETLLKALRDMRVTPMTRQGEPVEAMYDFACWAGASRHPYRYDPMYCRFLRPGFAPVDEWTPRSIVTHPHPPHVLGKDPQETP
ncbi:energy transducer TonB [Melittangium boletus]|uniref:energy transducer TonB n=1 Tax=Melittangium boletus TaxID=83453 RepID=UPI003DA48A6B